MRAKHIAGLLDAEEGGGRLISHAKLLLRLRTAADEVLPANLRRSCAIANLRQEKVVIFAENNAIAAKIRLYAPALLHGWAQRGLNVTGILVQAQAGAAVADPHRKPAQLSASAIAALRKIEAALDRSRLQEAQERLTNRTDDC